MEFSPWKGEARRLAQQLVVSYREVEKEIQLYLICLFLSLSMASLPKKTCFGLFKLQRDPRELSPLSETFDQCDKET